MKPLIFLLLLTVPLQAQTLADAAKKERARQASLRSKQVYEGKGGQTVAAIPAAPGTPATTAAPAAAAPGAAAPVAPAVPKETPKPAATAAPAPAPKPPDPAVKYAADQAKLRSKILELEDQERSLQLQVNQITNQLFAPVTDQNTRDQAQARLGEAQNKLTAVRKELDLTRKTLETLLAQGPPKQ